MNIDSSGSRGRRKKTTAKPLVKAKPKKKRDPNPVTPAMTAFRQELFGPVAAITIAKDAEHALMLANDSDFGLSATVFTTSDALAETFSRELECGGVFINGFSASDARVAFGGVKKSGFGRELSHFGLHEFCNVQTVWKNRV